jgi:hypothetical protein
MDGGRRQVLLDDLTWLPDDAGLAAPGQPGQRAQELQPAAAAGAGAGAVSAAPTPAPAAAAAAAGPPAPPPAASPTTTITVDLVSSDGSQPGEEPGADQERGFWSDLEEPGGHGQQGRQGGGGQLEAQHHGQQKQQQPGEQQSQGHRQAGAGPSSGEEPGTDDVAAAAAAGSQGGADQQRSPKPPEPGGARQQRRRLQQQQAQQAQQQLQECSSSADLAAGDQLGEGQVVIARDAGFEALFGAGPVWLAISNVPQRVRSMAARVAEFGGGGMAAQVGGRVCSRAPGGVGLPAVCWLLWCWALAQRARHPTCLGRRPAQVDERTTALLVHTCAEGLARRTPKLLAALALRVPVLRGAYALDCWQARRWLAPQPQHWVAGEEGGRTPLGGPQRAWQSRLAGGLGLSWRVKGAAALRMPCCHGRALQPVPPAMMTSPLLRRQVAWQQAHAAPSLPL